MYSSVQTIETSYLELYLATNVTVCASEDFLRSIILLHPVVYVVFRVMSFSEPFQTYLPCQQTL